VVDRLKAFTGFEKTRVVFIKVSAYFFLKVVVPVFKLGLSLFDFSLSIEGKHLLSIVINIELCVTKLPNEGVLSFKPVEHSHRFLLVSFIRLCL
jgi:hypothetical protein